MTERNKKYLDWIETLPCVVTGRRPAQAHHQWERHKKALGMKCSDYRVVPLCPVVHVVYHTKLGWKTYEEADVDIEEVIKTLNAWWKLWHNGRKFFKPDKGREWCQGRMRK